MIWFGQVNGTRQLDQCTVKDRLVGWWVGRSVVQASFHEGFAGRRVVRIFIVRGYYVMGPKQVQSPSGVCGWRGTGDFPTTRSDLKTVFIG